MCQQCADLAEKYLSKWMPRDEMYSYLFSNTCFPSGGPKHVEPQLQILGNLAESVGIEGAAWVLHGIWEDDEERELRGDPPFWYFLPLEWCEGLEQPAGEE